jgi:hypothetical protein
MRKAARPEHEAPRTDLEALTVNLEPHPPLEDAVRLVLLVVDVQRNPSPTG